MRDSPFSADLRGLRLEDQRARRRGGRKLYLLRQSRAAGRVARSTGSRLGKGKRDGREAGRIKKTYQVEFASAFSSGDRAYKCGRRKIIILKAKERNPSDGRQ